MSPGLARIEIFGVREFKDLFVFFLSGILVFASNSEESSIWGLFLYLETFLPTEFKFLRLILKLFLKPDLDMKSMLEYDRLFVTLVLS